MSEIARLNLSGPVYDPMRGKDQERMSDRVRKNKQAVLSNAAAKYQILNAQYKMKQQQTNLRMDKFIGAKGTSYFNKGADVTNPDSWKFSNPEHRETMLKEWNKNVGGNYAQFDKYYNDAKDFEMNAMRQRLLRGKGKERTTREYRIEFTDKIDGLSEAQREQLFTSITPELYDQIQSLYIQPDDRKGMFSGVLPGFLGGSGETAEFTNDIGDMLLNSGLADTREGATTGAHLIEGLGALALGLGLRKAVKWKFGKEAVDAVSKSKSKGKMTEALALVKGETSTNFSRLSTEQAKTVISAGKYKTLGDLAKAMDSGELTGAQAKAVAQKLLGKSVGSIDDIAAAAKQASAAVNKGNLLPGQRAPLTAPNKGVKDYLTGFFGNKGEKVTQATHNKVAMPNITNLQVGRSLPVNKISSAIKEVAIKVKTGQMTKDEGLALIEGLKKAAKSGKPINTEQLTFQFGKSPQGKSILSKIGSGAMKFAVVPLVAGQIGKTIAGTAGDTVGGEKGERIGEITGGHFGFLAGNKVYNVMKNTISKKGWKWMLNRVISKGGPSLVARTIGKAGVGAITGATGIGAVLSAGWLAADAYAIYQILQEAEDAGEI